MAFVLARLSDRKPITVMGDEEAANTLGLVSRKSIAVLKANPYGLVKLDHETVLYFDPNMKEFAVTYRIDGSDQEWVAFKYSSNNNPLVEFQTDLGGKATITDLVLVDENNPPNKSDVVVRLLAAKVLGD